MARILLLGPGDLVASFAGMIDVEHEVLALVDASTALPSHARAIESQVQIDDPIDLAIDLSVDDYSAVGERLISRRTTLSIASVVVVNGLTTTATAAASMLGLQNVLATTFLRGVTPTAAHLEVSRAMQSDREAAEDAVALLGSIIGRPVEQVEDRLGLVSARVLAMIVNEAAFAVMEGVATATDIDTAMKLGTNYPTGPLAWADTIGHDTVVRLLDALYAEYHEERYRACVLLRQHARASMPFARN